MPYLPKTDTVPELQWINRQPDELDYLRPNGFRFYIQSLPKVTYFCQSANIPTISLGVASQPTPFVDIPRPGEKLNYDQLTIQFLIQEDMSNYIELYNWMTSLGFPDSRSQYGQRFEEQKFRDPTPRGNRSGVTDMTDFSDAYLTILGSDYNEVCRVNFLDCFPVSLSGLEFDVSTGNTQYFAAQAVFKYRTFKVEKIAQIT
jgi:hypothetical protein